jgi:hypothetical protein
MTSMSELLRGVDVGISQKVKFRDLNVEKLRKRTKPRIFSRAWYRRTDNRRRPPFAILETAHQLDHNINLQRQNYRLHSLQLKILLLPSPLLET